MVSSSKWKSVNRLKGGLIVSCQASAGEPLCKPEHILALSLSALNGGAIALRLEGAENIRFVRQSKLVPAELPIIGLTKRTLDNPADYIKTAYITSTFAEARDIAEAGADIIALDATGRPRGDGLSLEETIGRIHNDLRKPVWADCARFSEAVAAAAAGADIVSTTMYGYTAETASKEELGPALDLLQQLVEEFETPVILEGRIWQPEQVSAGFARGAFAVGVGSAITRPQLITERFVKAISVFKPDTSLA
jgi:N-acylglucosamine-6-phosphate 2-epimerase